MTAMQPIQELGGVAHSGRKQQQADVRRQQSQRELPNHPALRIIEAMKFVHDHSGHPGKIEAAWL
ncbi:hypothetical protein HRbin36_02794 [bacterium HR36]|nr:hypothetical protein HRbin36_02794 [bacterium HR36]